MKNELAVPVGYSRGLVQPYLELMKLRVSGMVTLTTAAGFYLASQGSLDWFLLITSCLATTLLAGGAACLNQAMERTQDARMTRTAGRPLPTARVSLLAATTFGLLLIALGALVIAIVSGLVPTFLGLASAVIYLACYTPLKRRTAFCTTVGAVPGAIPPLIGWTAAGGELGLEALALFLILFFWQYPHFLAIAWMYRDDYERGGFRMLPLIDRSGEKTAGQILLFAAILLLVSLLPWSLKLAGNLYLASAVLLGAAFAMTSVGLLRRPSVVGARQVMKASVLYLPLLLAVLVVDKL